MYLARKCWLGTLYFTSSNGDGTAILRGHPSHAKVSPLAVQRKYLHFSVILRLWVMVRPRESNPRPHALQKGWKCFNLSWVVLNSHDVFWNRSILTRFSPTYFNNKHFRNDDVLTEGSQPGKLFYTLSFTCQPVCSIKHFGLVKSET